MCLIHLRILQLMDLLLEGNQANTLLRIELQHLSDESLKRKRVVDPRETVDERIVINGSV